VAYSVASDALQRTAEESSSGTIDAIRQPRFLSGVRTNQAQVHPRRISDRTSQRRSHAPDKSPRQRVVANVPSFARPSDASPKTPWSTTAKSGFHLVAVLSRWDDFGGWTTLTRSSASPSSNVGWPRRARRRRPGARHHQTDPALVHKRGLSPSHALFKRGYDEDEVDTFHRTRRGDATKTDSNRVAVPPQTCTT